ncbi:MAG TPA: transporter, partial [Ignavibacteria bacterium]|nr:transporter [Ignavibacteria bacterium]
MKTTILFLLVFIFTINIFSQADSVFSVDHSKVTLSTDIIPQWKVQMEIGGSIWYTENTFTQLSGTPEQYTATYYSMRINNPALAFRIGVFQNVELRLGFVFIQEFYGTLSSDSWFFDGRRNGIYSGGPIEAGIKVKLLEENKLIPSTAIKADVFIPAGNYYFHMDYVSPVFRLMLQKNIAKNFSIGVNAGYGWNVYDNFTYKYGSYSASLNANVSKKLGAFAETFSYFQHERKPDHRIAAGLTYRFSRSVMTVVQGGFGISERAPDMFASGGIGFM